MRSIFSPGSRTAAAEPITTPPAAEHAPKPLAPEAAETPDNAQTNPRSSEKQLGKHHAPADIETRHSGHRAVRHEGAGGKSDAEAHNVSIATSSQATQEDARTGENAKLQIRKMVLTKTTKYNPAAEKMLRKGKLVASQNSGIAREDSIAASGEGDQAKDNPNSTEDKIQEALKQQLQQLSKQVESLKEALEKNMSGAVDNPSKPAVERRTLEAVSPPHLGNKARATRSPKDVHRIRNEQAKLHGRPTQLSDLEPTRPAAPGIVRDERSTIHVIARANRGFRKNISEMISVAHALRRVKAGVSKPMIGIIERRLVAIAQDACRIGDARMESALEQYNRWDKLESVSKLPPVPKSKLSKSTQEQQRATSIPLVRRVELVTNKDLRTVQKQSTALSELEGAPTETDSSCMTHKNTQEKVDEAVTAESTAKSVDNSTRFAREQQPAGETNTPELPEQNDKQKLARHIHAHSRAMLSSSHLQHSALWVPAEKRPLQEPAKSSIPETANLQQKSPGDTIATTAQNPSAPSDEISDQSLLEELFPEASIASPVRHVEKQEQYPKLHPPEPAKVIHRKLVDRPMTLKEQATQAFKKRGEPISALQLEHCSTELTESDFRRLIPKGEHIEAWNRLGAYYKIIPGRDPLSLERLPFYYLLFKSPESAYAYQRNAGRLHKLAALHQPSNIFSAIPAPKGFLEDGEDIDAVTSSYLLRPTEHAFTLRTLVQPYHPALRALFERGGYNPIVSSKDDKMNRIHKVLMHIEGYEPSLSDLFKALRHDAYSRGIPFTLRNELSSSIHRLRDLINLKTHTLPISTISPRAFEGHKSNEPKIEYEDPSIAFFMRDEGGADEENAKVMNQVVMNRVYNRWILEFDEEDEARRFAISWHRRVLPDFVMGQRTWKDYEEVRMCNTELLW